ncbi:MAG: lysylphosphatidylglycerol synthase transmembrane domain-containing protein [Thermodesulfobacteriota bacterium]|nr:lysylphosphatidylglycerol synthase transmembrane domain-containing protein [Thermodesulfobacteriota bacterium]
MKRLWHVLGWLVGAISLGIFLVYFFDWETTKDLFLNIKVSFVCLGASVFCLTILLRVAKWVYIINISEHVSLRDGYHTIMISNMVNFLLPVRAGEFLKLYLINKSSGISYQTSITATLWDRSTHIILMMVFLLLMPVADFKFSQWTSNYVLVFIFSVIFVVLVFVFGTRCLNILEAVVGSFSELMSIERRKVDILLQSRVASFFRETLDRINISSFKKGDLLLIGLVTCIIICLDGVCYYFVIRAFEIHITWLQGILAACLMCLAFILPTPPGLIGTAEMYPIIIFSWGLGLPESVVSSAAILWHLLTIAFVILLGICSLLAMGLTFGSLFKNRKIHTVGNSERGKDTDS